MYKSSYSNQFKKDYKKCKKRGLSEDLIKEYMSKIIMGEALPPRAKPHQLIGNYADCMECHIKPDWLLIYLLDEEEEHVEFVRTGTHSDLFS